MQLPDQRVGIVQQQAARSAAPTRAIPSRMFSSVLAERPLDPTQAPLLGGGPQRLDRVDPELAWSSLTVRGPTPGMRSMPAGHPGPGRAAVRSTRAGRSAESSASLAVNAAPAPGSLGAPARE